jgi:hypothetical protein
MIITSVPAILPQKFNELLKTTGGEWAKVSKHHRYKLAANTMSLLITLMPSLNLFSKSVLPIFFAAWHSCRRTSSSLRMQRMILPKHRTVSLGYPKQTKKETNKLALLTRNSKSKVKMSFCLSTMNKHIKRVKVKLHSFFPSVLHGGAWPNFILWGKSLWLPT